MSGEKKEKTHAHPAITSKGVKKLLLSERTGLSQSACRGSRDQQERKRERCVKGKGGEEGGSYS